MKYFTMKELTRSSTATAYQIENTPNKEQEANLIALAENILDPLREAYGDRIFVNVAFRNKEVNKLVGGVPNSQHLKGQAADITTYDLEENEELFRLAQELDLPFDQLIDEKNYSWVHISYRKDGKNRKQVLHL